jgi:uncharacterized protein (DUF362 family)
MRFINRRTFLGGSVAAVATLRHSDARAAESLDLVDVSGSDPKAMVKKALEGLGGIAKFVKKGDYVVLKPNAGFANPPDWATTTHPDVVAAVAQACLDAKAKQVVIVEYPLAKAEKCFARCGLNDALASMPQVKIKAVLDPSDFQKVDIKGGTVLKQVEVAKAVLSADVLINIPQAKQHNAGGVSFGMKNHMGIIWDRKSFHTAFDLHEGVADLARVIKPQLTILDATRALLSNGPAGPGDTVTPGRIVAGRNVVSVDAYGLTLARFNSKQMTPADARHILLAGKAGLGEIDLSKLKVKKLAA